MVERRRLVGGAAVVAGVSAGAALVGATPWSHAQGRFPERPITLVVPFAPGGIADITARAVAEPMARALGQAVVVENKPSAGSIVATQTVVSAKPDGHTLLLMSNGHAVSVSLFKKLPYELARDLAPIGTLASFELAVFCAAGSRFTTLRDALAAAKAAPGKLSVGTIAVGSTQNLAARLLESLAGVELMVVPYKATPAVVSAVRTGEVELAVEIVAPMLSQLTPTGVRALAVAAESRHPALPEVPTAIEQGVGGFQVASWNGLAAPAGTPAAAIDTLQQALHAALASVEVQAQFRRLGVRAMPGTPAALRRLLASETQRWAEVIRRAKIEPE